MAKTHLGTTSNVRDMLREIAAKDHRTMTQVMELAFKEYAEKRNIDLENIKN